MRTRCAGFSLIELLVVIGIMSIGIAVIPSFRSWMGAQRNSSAARILAADLRWARSLAVDHNRDVYVTFDTGTNSYSIYDDAGMDGIGVGDLVKTVSLAEVGKGVRFNSTSAAAIGGGALSAAVMMGGTSNPIRVIFKASGEAIHPGAAYLISDLDLASGLRDRNRAVQIFSTGKVRMMRWRGTSPSDPWVEFY